VPEKQSPSLRRIAINLARAGGSVKLAAKAMGMDVRELRKRVDAEDGLQEAAMEAEERSIDLAKQQIRDGMRDEHAMNRMQAAVAWLALTEAGRKRWRGR
jgi:hypothetical protein